MKSCLFIVDYWTPRENANTLCIKKIARELKQQGINVFVTSYGDKNTYEPLLVDDTPVYFIKPTLARRLLNKSSFETRKWHSRFYELCGKGLNRLRRLVLLPFYPIVSFSISRRWSKQICRIVEKNSIDCIVSVSAPDESLYVGYLVKKNIPSIKWIIYYLDSGTNILPGASYGVLKRTLLNKAVRWERRNFSHTSRVVVMKGHSKYYEDTYPELIASGKIAVSDIPLFDADQVETLHVLSKFNNWLYAGTMNGEYYDPHAICALFKAYHQKHPNSRLDLYGPSNFVDFLKSQSEYGIYWHGPVPHRIVEQKIKEADVLSYFKMVPMDSVSGKTFEYVASGKPIIYLGFKGDINAQKLNTYPLAECLDLKDNIDNSVINVEAFFDRISGGKYAAVDLYKEFVVNTPAYTAKIIAEI